MELEAAQHSDSAGAVLMQDGRAVADGPVAETVTPDNVATVFEVSPDLVFGDRLTV
mgnify:CR=1 FL=1